MKFFFIFRPLRLDHWAKNSVLILGSLTAVIVDNSYKINLLHLVLAFLSLSFAASGNYLINEYFDKEEDKYHPIKKKRNFVKKNYRLKNILFFYLILILFSILLSITLSKIFKILILIFIFFGLLYNLPPVRLKNFFFIDTITESINLPLRYLMGWCIVINNYFPPISIVLFFWTFGFFLMIIKRSVEFNFLIINNVKPYNYRKSYNYYNKNLLIFLSWCSGLLSFFFISIFIIKYRVELLITVPTLVICYSYYYLMAFQNNSLTITIEKIYLDKKLLLMVVILILQILIGLIFDHDFFKSFTSLKLIKLF